MAAVRDSPSHEQPASEAALVNTPSNLQLFTRNLRLLDLDLLPDWPNVNLNTFKVGRDVHSTRTERIHAAEWVFYRLFELYDPKETRTKLQPYFPVFESLQSIKLRAAFLQWLMLLKTTGVLGRECAVRKGIFDDCTGEKFEGILLHFSTVVLQKVVQDETLNKARVPLAQRLAISSNKTPEAKTMMQSLVLAHQSGLRLQLARRHLYRDQMNRLSKTFDDRRTVMITKIRQLKAEVQTHESVLIGAGADAHQIKKQLRQNGNGDANWLSIILSGDTEQGRDVLVERPFPEILAEVKAGQPLNIIEEEHVSESQSLLLDLEARVNAQKDRLNDWRDFQKQLSKRNQSLIVSRSPAKTPMKTPNKSKFSSPSRTPFASGPLNDPSSATQTKTKHESRSTRDARGGQHARSSTIHTLDAPSFHRKNVSVCHARHSPSVDWTSPSQSRLKCALTNSPHSRSRSDMPSLTTPPYFAGKYEMPADSTRGDGDSPMESLPHAESNKPGIKGNQSSTFEKMGIEERSVPQPSPADTSLAEQTKESPAMGSQTLSERTLQSLQQCQIPQQSKMQRHRLAHSYSKPKPTEQSLAPSSLSSSEIHTPDSSRPGTAKTGYTTDSEDFVATSLREATSGLAQIEEPKRFWPMPKPPSRPASPVKASTNPPFSDAGPSQGETTAASVKPVDEVSEAPSTPPENVYAMDAECASVFKSRSKLRHSPPGSPLYALSPGKMLGED